MQNIKYIIIFTLLLALGLVYSQLKNYKDITNELLIQSDTQTNKIKLLESNNSKQNITITNLQKDLSSQQENLLDENLSKKNLSEETDNTHLYKQIIMLEEQIVVLEKILFNTGINYTTATEKLNYTETNIEPIDESNNTKSETLDIKPNITLDDENKITGFGLEYKQEF